MAQNIVFPGDMPDGAEMCIMRLKGDHSQLEVAKPGSGIFTGRSDAELLTELIDTPAVSYQDDGLIQLSFNTKAYGAHVLDFINNYNVASEDSDREDYKGYQGKVWEAAAASNEDQLFAVVDGPVDPDTGKRLIYAFPCSLVISSSGGHEFNPDEAVSIQVTLKMIKPKQDILFHTGTGSPTTLNPDTVDIASETTDISALTGTKKYHYEVANVA